VNDTSFLKHVGSSKTGSNHAAPCQIFQNWIKTILVCLMEPNKQLII